jgi:hypothetical protein
MSGLEHKVSRNSKYYKEILKISEYYVKISDIEAAINIASLAASFSASNYCGFYSDNKIETLLNNIGKKILPITERVSQHKAGAKQRILHYATMLLNVGGHTRLLDNWVKADTSNSHDIFLSKQSCEIPFFITETIKSNGGTIYNYNDQDLFINRIEALKSVSEQYDMVVLHHHPDDVIPAIAFAHSSDTPIAVLNHGDHKYWVGTSICDNLIEIRDNLIPYDELRRAINTFSLLPIPITITKQDKYKVSRETLGIDDDEIILLSIGSEYKYSPFEGKNFFEDIIEVISQCSLAKIFVVGVSSDSGIASQYSHPKIVYVNATPEIDLYRHACDIYVEGYPFSSFTAYLEVGALRKPIHFMYEAPLLNTYNLTNYQYPFKCYNSKSEWQQGLLNLIYNPELRNELGNQFYTNIETNHAMPGWYTYLVEFYSAIKNKKHQVRIASDNCFVLTSNEGYLDYMLDHRIINILRHAKGSPFNYKLAIVYNLFIKEDYSNLMFGEDDVFRANKDLSYIYKIGLVCNMFIYGKVSSLKVVKACFTFLFKKVNKY